MPVTPHSRQTISKRGGLNRKALGAVGLLVMLCLTGCGNSRDATGKSSTGGNTPYEKGFAAGEELAQSYVLVIEKNLEAAKQYPGFKDNVANLQSKMNEWEEKLRDNASSAKASYEERKQTSSAKDEDSRNRLKYSADNAEFTRGQYEGFVSLVKPYL